MNGWIKIHRKILDWGWYDDTNTTRLFLHLLLIANHKPNVWHGTKIEVGQAIIGRKELSKTLGISEQSIRTSLTKLKSTNEITIKSTNKFSIITLSKYSDYQLEEKNQPANQPPNQPTTNQQLTSNQPHLKNIRNKETIVQPVVARVIPSNQELISSKQKHIHIIGLYWNYLETKFDNYEQYQSQLKRNFKAAKNLIGYEDKQILEAMRYYDKQSENGKKFNWTLETLLKYL